MKLTDMRVESSLALTGTPTLPRFFGEAMVALGKVPPEVVQYVLQKQQIERAPLGRMFIDLGFAASRDVCRVIAQMRGHDFVEEEAFPSPNAGLLARFNRAQCAHLGFLPIREERDVIEVLIGDADPAAVEDAVRRRTGKRVRCLQGEFDAVARWIQYQFHFSTHPVEQLIHIEIRKLEDDVDRLYSPELLLDHLLHLAVRERATDIHLAPTERSRSVLLRIDGVLQPVLALSPALDRLITFIKLRAEMDVSEKRLPQDGSFHAEVLHQRYSIRVSTLIGAYGERAVLRLLPERASLGGLRELGFWEEDVQSLEGAFRQPHGLVLITGPTGSGKSTTLHSALRMQSLIRSNVLTVEDPVEYRVPAACQTEVNRRAGYEFGSAMRHFLRHDPDVILVGEIRDSETARAAIDAASTGHLVLSTLHVGGIFGVFPRMRLLGVEPDMLADNLLAVINQRLLRRVCGRCVQWRPVETREALLFESHGLTPPQRLAVAQGCDHCRHIGYTGRAPVYEMLGVTRVIADAIAESVPRVALRELATAGGMRSMASMALQRVAAGETTLDEAQRHVTFEV